MTEAPGRWLPEVRERVMQIKAEVINTHKKCGGTGYLQAEGGYGSKRCSCMIVFRYLKELVKSNIPQDYWCLRFDELNLDDLIHKIISTYLKNIRRAQQNGLGLVLFGQNGTGKTSVMAEIAKLAIVKGYGARYFTLSSYVDAVFSKNTERVAYYENGDFLFIDELDKKAGSAAIHKLVDEFFRRMFNQNKSIILGTNWDTDEFKECLGESTFSLLKRRCEFIEFQGDDYSDNLQESYIDRLENSFDYFAPSITEYAMERELNTQTAED